MPFDYKKAYRELYQPKAASELIRVPETRYLAMRGAGDPNEKDGAYNRAIGMLYAVSYALKMSSRRGHWIEGFFDYVVPPLEGFWRQSNASSVFDPTRKGDFRWVSAIRLPDFVSEDDVRWAIEEAKRKKRGASQAAAPAGRKTADALPSLEKEPDFSDIELLRVDEGLCVQMMHIGPFDAEAASIARMNAFLAENGYACDFSPSRLHHEIYLSDIRKTAPEHWKTVIRQPIRKTR